MLATAPAVAAQTSVTLLITVQTPGEFGDQPVVGAHVTVRKPKIGLPGERIALGELVVFRLTDAMGSVTLPVRAGTYELTVTAEGYAPAEFDHVFAVAGDVALAVFLDPSPPELPAPETTAPTPALPNGIISGQVVTVQGEPIAKAVVSASHNGRDAGQAVADDNGRFRVEVATTSLMVQTYRLTIHSSIPPASPKLPPLVYVPVRTEFPFDIPVSPDHETPGIQVPVRAQRLVRLTVSTRDVAGEIPPQTHVSITGPQIRGSRPVTADGTAVFGPLRPGRLTVMAISDGTSPRLAATASVEVHDQPVDDLVLLLRPGARLTGRVEFQGLQRPLHSSWPLQVSISTARSSDDTNGRVDADGSFVLDGLVGEHCLLLHGIPYGWRLERITQQGRDVTGVSLMFESGQEVEPVVFLVGVGTGGSGIASSSCAK